uniref:NADH-ubiquinone oxidoreductase chain 5 n=1 Tax=Homolobus sp. QL-2013 TaxID=1421595 RepID=A0A0A6ZL63_9HYME|nr:NADH dehydrogenase subunit 5 [Homolobus sp. QL-2013]
MYYIMSFYLMNLSMISIIMSILFIMNKNNIFLEWLILNLYSLKIEFIMFIDWISLMFISTIFLISAMVILYSISYMNNHLSLNRFMMIILIFVTSMIFMIMSPNMISIMLGWDGLGLSSYCLVIFYQNKKSFNSGMITILMNRFGDICILILISLMMIKNSWNFLFFNNLNNFIMIFILLAAMTKSAQIPFSTWLPLAMAAPTPISSLVHSSTLVTAGVYILIRFNYLMNNKILMIIMFISSMTMFMAGISANFEYDLKKIIALSTLSQLGLMIFTIAMTLKNLAFFHLITHAMFKSLLFLCSGIIIHNYFNNQDIRFISNMSKNMPFINMIFNMASLTLCGMPFLAGFYSKDFIIEMFNMKNNNYFMFLIMYMSMGLTMSYSFRLIYFISIKNYKMMNFNLFKLKNLMNYSILILMLLSMFYGSILNWLIFNSLNYIFLNKSLKLLIYYFMILGMILGMIMSFINYKISYMNLMFKYMNIFNYMMYLPKMFIKNKMNIFKMNNKFMNLNDLGWMEYLTIKKKINIMMKINYMKKINKLNFLMMIMMTIYMLMFMLFF